MFSGQCLLIYCYSVAEIKQEDVNTSACTFKTRETLKQATYCKTGERKSTIVMRTQV